MARCWRKRTPTGVFERGRRDGRRCGRIERAVLDRRTGGDGVGRQVEGRTTGQRQQEPGHRRAVALAQLEAVVVALIRGGRELPAQRGLGTPERIAVGADDVRPERGQPEEAVQHPPRLRVVPHQVDGVAEPRALRERLPEQRDLGGQQVAALLVELLELPGLDGAPVERSRLAELHEPLGLGHPQPQLDLVGRTGVVGRTELQVGEQVLPAVHVASAPPSGEGLADLREIGQRPQELRPGQPALLGGKRDVAPELAFVLRRGRPCIELLPRVGAGELEAEPDEVVPGEEGPLAQLLEAFLQSADEIRFRPRELASQRGRGLLRQHARGERLEDLFLRHLLAGAQALHGRGAVLDEQRLHRGVGVLATAAHRTAAFLPPGARLRVIAQRGLVQRAALDIGGEGAARLVAAQVAHAAFLEVRLTALADQRRQLLEELLRSGVCEMREIGGLHVAGEPTRSRTGDKPRGHLISRGPETARRPGTERPIFSDTMEHLR